MSWSMLRVRKSSCTRNNRDGYSDVEYIANYFSCTEANSRELLLAVGVFQDSMTQKSYIVSACCA